MRVIVTGGAGFIGSHVAEAYRADGHEVLVIDDLSTGSEINLPSDVEFAEADVASAVIGSLFTAFAPDVVNHHAAQASVARSTSSPGVDLSINGVGTANVVAAAIESGARNLVHISSGGAIYGEPIRNPVDESHSVEPLSNYGRSKHVGELYVKALCHQAGLPFTILRYSNVYGPRQDPFGEAGVIAAWAHAMLLGEFCRLDGDGRQARDFVFVADVVSANRAALRTPLNDCVNIGSGTEVTINELFETMARISSYREAPHSAPSRPGDVRRIHLDIGRARTRLDWGPSTDLYDGLRMTFDWMRGRAKPRAGRAG